MSSRDSPRRQSLDKSHSDRGLDHQPAVLDVNGSDDDVVLRTPSRSLPAVGFPSLHADSPSHHHHHHQLHHQSPTVAAHGGAHVKLATDAGSQKGLEVSAAEGAALDAAGGFLDVDDDGAMHVDRDPNHWHDMVKIKFDDVFGEPEPDLFSMDNTWTSANKVFALSKFWCYRILSLVLAVPMAAIWGVYFAGMVFCRIWCCVPCLKACDIQLHCVRRLNESLFRTFVAPFYEAVGRCFYHIRLRIVKATDENP